jgi:phosphatidylinositol dimannoside acyltransferase
MSTLRDRAIRYGYAIGWRVARTLPCRLVTVIISVVSDQVLRHDGIHVRTLRHNLSAATGRPVTDVLAREALASFLRYLYEVLALPSWSPRKVIGYVETEGEREFRTTVATRGAVVALPHSGNWDLTGAWACLTRLPVTTVAEQLSGGAFESFLHFRQRLGMEVLSHRDPAAISKLVEAVRRGRVVCLLADRDLEGRGLPVEWRGQPITMPAGPAVVARRSGAALVPLISQYTPCGMKIIFGSPVEPRPGREGLVWMTQQVADFFAERIAEQPEDWHVMQPFFDSTDRAA